MKMTLNLKEAAEELGISEPTMRELIRQKDFPAMKIGKLWKVSRRGLEAWIDEKTKDKAEIEV